MPTFDSQIPQPPDILSDSQDDILQNFQQLNTAWNVNHSPFNGLPQGKHTEVTLPENTVPGVTAIDEANIYSQLSTLTAQTELFWQRENNGARIQWTAKSSGVDGWTYLPSGILLKWGFGTKTGFGQVVSLPAGNPRFTTVFTVFVTPSGIIPGDTGQANYIALSFNTVPDPQTFEVNCFDITGASSLENFYFLIIGV